MIDPDQFINGPVEVMTLFYDPPTNRFFEDFGRIVHDIHRLITPGQLLVFKRKQEDVVVADITNSFLIELLYPDDMRDCRDN